MTRTLPVQTQESKLSVVFTVQSTVRSAVEAAAAEVVVVRATACLARLPSSDHLRWHISTHSATITHR